MARSLKEKLATLEPARRAAIEDDADRLHAEYLKHEEERTAKQISNGALET